MRTPHNLHYLKLLPNTLPPIKLIFLEALLRQTVNSRSEHLWHTDSRSLEVDRNNALNALRQGTFAAESLQAKWPAFGSSPNQKSFYPLLQATENTFRLAQAAT
jgi:hypothetical protein